MFHFLKKYILTRPFIKRTACERIPEGVECCGASQPVTGATGAVPGEVQKDAVVLRLRVQRLQDVVHGVAQAGWWTGAGAQALGQHPGGCGACAVCVLSWGRLWEDAGGRML